MLTRLKLIIILLWCWPIMLEAKQVLAPGYGALRYSAPMPGTYRLPKMALAEDGKVVDSTGHNLSLKSLLSGKVAVLSFIYATCSDNNGCPLATHVLQKLAKQLVNDKEMAKKVRLLTLSFNPAYDTPARMKAYEQSFQVNGADWQFLTTVSEAELLPILQAYSQNIDKVYDKQGSFTNTFNHALRVYLIDAEGQIRSIYNADLLHADTLLADIKTVLLPEKAVKKQPFSSSQQYTPGDNKVDYEQKDYQTRSIAMLQRRGQATDLLKTIVNPVLGLPKLIISEENPISLGKIALGRKLFYDRRLSGNNTFSCAMCHIPEQGFTSNEMAKAVGVEGRTVRRNSPTLFNVGYQQTLFHDGRETTLAQQVWGPLLAVNEMANPSIGFVIEKIKAIPDYVTQFNQEYGKPPSMETVGQALASYEFTLNSADSPFDRWYYGKQSNALSASAQRGFQIFTGKGHCNQCHIIEKENALFTDHHFHNTGIGYKAAMQQPSFNTQKIQLAPGLFIEPDNKVIEAFTENKANDLGRYEVTFKPQDRWRYKTPLLRNVNLTAPYMHDGSLSSLRAVVEFYNRGGIANENLDPLIKPLNLTDSEINELIDFLQSLNGSNVEELVADAFAAPVSDAE